MPNTTRIPHACPAVLGVFHHEGHIAALVDLNQLTETPGDASVRPAVIVIEHEDRLLGLVVELVHEVIQVPDAAYTTTPGDTLPRGLAALVDGVVLPGAQMEDDAVTTARPSPDPRLAALLTEAPGWLARIHDPDLTVRARSNATRARSVLGEGSVHLLDPVRVWDTVAAWPRQEDPS